MRRLVLIAAALSVACGDPPEVDWSEATNPELVDLGPVFVDVSVALQDGKLSEAFDEQAVRENAERRLRAAGITLAQDRASAKAELLVKVEVFVRSENVTTHAIVVSLTKRKTWRHFFDATRPKPPIHLQRTFGISLVGSESRIQHDLDAAVERFAESFRKSNPNPL